MQCTTNKKATTYWIQTDITALNDKSNVINKIIYNRLLLHEFIQIQGLARKARLNRKVGESGGNERNHSDL